MYKGFIVTIYPVSTLKKRMSYSDPKMVRFNPTKWVDLETTHCCVEITHKSGLSGNSEKWVRLTQKWVKLTHKFEFWKP